MSTSYRDISDDALRVLGELRPIVNRLLLSVQGQSDPFDVISNLDSKVSIIEDELSKTYLNRMRAWFLSYLEDQLKEHDLNIHVLLPEYGVPVRLLSTLMEIVSVIILRNPGKISVISFNMSRFGSLSCHLSGLNIKDLSFDSLHKAVAMLDGYINRKETDKPELSISNILDREKFVIINSKSGFIGIPALLAENIDNIRLTGLPSAQNINLRLGCSEQEHTFEIISVEDTIRYMPKLAYKMPWFKGVFMSSGSRPVPVLNILELFERGRPEWL